MEFDTLSEFVMSLKYAKRRYPMIVTYIKHLKKISSDDDKTKEVEHFKRFLIANQSISEKKLDQHDFKTGKMSLTLAMDNFISVPGVEVDMFWENILKLEKTLFPEGKPTEMPHHDGAQGLTGALASFENNPIMLDVIEQVKTMDDLNDISDISALMAKPGFKQMVNNIKNNLQEGKYNINDLTGTVASVINSIKDELDDDTKKTLKVVTDTMGAVERNEPVDINNLMNAVSGLKLDNLSNIK
jgi:hypothetical protein